MEVTRRKLFGFAALPFFRLPAIVKPAVPVVTQLQDKMSWIVGKQDSSGKLFVSLDWKDENGVTYRTETQVSSLGFDPDKLLHGYAYRVRDEPIYEGQRWFKGLCVWITGYTIMCGPDAELGYVTSES